MTLTVCSHCFLRLAFFAWLLVGVSTEVMAQYRITSLITNEMPVLPG